MENEKHYTQNTCEVCGETKDTCDMHAFKINGEYEHVCSTDECIESWNCDKHYCDFCNEWFSTEPGHIWDTPFYFVNDYTIACSNCGERSYTNGDIELSEIETIGFKYLPVLPSYKLSIIKEKFTLFQTIEPNEDIVKNILKQIETNYGSDVPMCFNYTDDHISKLNVWIGTEHFRKTFDEENEAPDCSPNGGGYYGDIDGKQQPYVY